MFFARINASGLITRVVLVSSCVSRETIISMLSGIAEAITPQTPASVREGKESEHNEYNDVTNTRTHNISMHAYTYIHSSTHTAPNVCLPMVSVQYVQVQVRVLVTSK